MSENNTPIPRELLEDPLACVRRGTHYTKKQDGYVYIIEAATGATLALLDSVYTVPTQWVQKQNPNGSPLWIQESLAESITLQSGTKPSYSPIVIDEICRRIAEGEALTRICGSSAQMPTYNEFCRWRRANPWIEEAILRAREDRAEALRDQAITIADSAVDKNDAPAKQLQVEVRKWSAGVDSPRYSPKAKVEANINVPTQIVISTGIDRSKDD